eukprot:COSAG06_NODE_5464_length_3463_cov_4.573424_1_plen_165_part_10
MEGREIPFWHCSIERAQSLSTALPQLHLHNMACPADDFATQAATVAAADRGRARAAGTRDQMRFTLFKLCLLRPRSPPPCLPRRISLPLLLSPSPSLSLPLHLILPIFILPARAGRAAAAAAAAGQAGPGSRSAADPRSRTARSTPAAGPPPACPRSLRQASRRA